MCASMGAYTHAYVRTRASVCACVRALRSCCVFRMIDAYIAILYWFIRSPVSLVKLRHCEMDTLLGYPSCHFCSPDQSGNRADGARGVPGAGGAGGVGGGSGARGGAISEPRTTDESGEIKLTKGVGDCYEYIIIDIIF